MDENQKILKEQFNKLPQNLRDFVSKGNWSGEVLNIAKKVNLPEEKGASFENEVLFVLIGLEPLSSLKNNLEKELEIDTGTAERIAGEVNRNIFSKVANEIDSMWQSESAGSVEGSEQSKGKEQPKSTGVGNSFEQIILNQARAMQPAIPPKNLPVSNKPNISVPNYSNNQDPYREPAE